MYVGLEVQSAALDGPRAGKPPTVGCPVCMLVWLMSGCDCVVWRPVLAGLWFCCPRFSVVCTTPPQCVCHLLPSLCVACIARIAALCVHHLTTVLLLVCMQYSTPPCCQERGLPGYYEPLSAPAQQLPASAEDFRFCGLWCVLLGLDRGCRNHCAIV